MDNLQDTTYLQTLETLKSKIKSAQIKAVLSVNAQLVILYWEIGETILKRQQTEGWGSKVIANLSKDLTSTFPNMTGFSERNLKYMRKFAQTYPDFTIVQEVLAQITWYHNIALLDKLSIVDERIWYAKQTIEHGWSRNILVHQIESKLYERQFLAEKTNNFALTLPPIQSDLANELMKDTYNFEFLTMSEQAKELEIENALLKNVTKFLLELGKGFAFIGEQYHLEVGGQDYYIDLLFYNTKLHCYVVLELKIGDFKPEYTGKVNFYLNAVDDIVKTKEDNPSIGIILCKSKNKIVTEYALKNISKPIGISEYTITQTISEDLRSKLPTQEEFEEQLT